MRRPPPTWGRPARATSSFAAAQALRQRGGYVNGQLCLWLANTAELHGPDSDGRHCHRDGDTWPCFDVQAAQKVAFAVGYEQPSALPEAPPDHPRAGLRHVASSSAVVWAAGRCRVPVPSTRPAGQYRDRPPHRRPGQPVLLHQPSLRRDRPPLRPVAARAIRAFRISASCRYGDRTLMVNLSIGIYGHDPKLDRAVQVSIFSYV